MLWLPWRPELLEKEKQQQQHSRVLTEKGLEREIKQRTETKKTVKFENGNDKF